MRKLLFASAVAFVLYGCNTLSKKECIQGDWRSIGFSDGANGYQIDRIEDHRKSCAEHARSIDLDAYRAGREEGLKTLCTRAGGYRQGSDNRTFKDVCPQQLSRDYLEGYLAGVDNALRRAETKLSESKWRYKRLENQLKREKEPASKEAKQSRLDRLGREVESNFREVESLQQKLDDAELRLRQS